MYFKNKKTHATPLENLKLRRHHQHRKEAKNHHLSKTEEGRTNPQQKQKIPATPP